MVANPSMKTLPNRRQTPMSRSCAPVFGLPSYIFQAAYTVFRRMLISDSDMYVATDNDIKPAAIYYTDEDTRNVK